MNYCIQLKWTAGRSQHCAHRWEKANIWPHLPRKPKKKVISTLSEWVRCSSVYASTLCAYQPHRGPDTGMLAYLYVIASVHEEFQFAVCMAYDVAFRKKAANFRLSSWGHIDPQIYSKAFTGATKVKTGAHCSLCLSTSNSTSECPLYSSGPAKKAWTGLAGPKRLVPLHNGKEICLNFHRDGCSKENCTRAHACSFRGHIDPQIYSKAFTGATKVKTGAHCSLCLSTSNSTSECPLYSSGPAKKAWTGLAGPKCLVPLHNGKEICLNFNRDGCSRENCTRAHACSFRSCGAHPATQCTLRCSSPRKR